MSYKEADSSCTYLCDDPSQEFKKYKCKLGSMKIKVTVQDIMEELMTNGPMQIGLTIYSDFYSYGSGVYEQTTSTYEGRHAIKLLGWDVDGNGELYWICQN